MGNREKLMGVKKIGTLLTPKVVNIEHFELTETYCVTLQGSEEQVELFTSEDPIEMFNRLANEVREHRTYEL